MDVRPVRPTDAPLVLALVLDAGSHLVRSCAWSEDKPTTQSILRAIIPMPAMGRSWIARHENSIALLEARPRQYVIGWDVTRLVVRGNPDYVLPAVVAAAKEHLQSRGVPRLFARVSSDSHELLLQIGFTPLAREYILLSAATDSQEDVPLPAESRYRMPQDAWPLHQLEQELTPALVRQIEGLTSMDWVQNGRQRSDIVVEIDGKIAAWIGWMRKPRQGFYQMGMMIHPDYPDLGPDLLRYALRSLPPGSRCAARVREYQTEALRTFTDAGFSIEAEDTLMVKHAGLELAREPKGLRRVVGVPSMQVFHNRMGTLGPPFAPVANEQSPFEDGRL